MTFSLNTIKKHQASPYIFHKDLVLAFLLLDVCYHVSLFPRHLSIYLSIFYPSPIGVGNSKMNSRTAVHPETNRAVTYCTPAMHMCVWSLQFSGMNIAIFILPRENKSFEGLNDMSKVPELSRGGGWFWIQVCLPSYHSFHSSHYHPPLCASLFSFLGANNLLGELCRLIPKCECAWPNVLGIFGA